MFPRVDELTESMRSRGYAIFERVYDDEEIALFTRALDGLHERLGRPICYSPEPRELAPFVQTSGTGLVAAKLVERCPQIAPYLLKPAVVAVMRGFLGGDMRLELTAGVLADEHREQFPWHTHIGGQDDTHYKRLGEWPRIDRPGRVGTLTYLEDIDDDGGPLVLYPRSVGDATAPPFDPEARQWAGEVVVRVPRGTLVAMDECTWHTARQKRTPGLRRIVGCNFASASTPPSPVLETSLAGQQGGALFQSVAAPSPRGHAAIILDGNG